ncbi:unnamed protein product [Paramecium pentaurelia]|uniref:Uncharacterized protein n=1 Tax=Paramecium pentaurelia TaxID=43138 RepID=A0A8S1XH88_9CILI|nr:unnamed protein product [Paramecium pentaurelia]
MNRLNKFAFSKKLNKIIQNEAERERIRKQVGESGTFEENGKAYYYRDGKINKLDYIKREELKLQAKLDPYIKDKETKQQLPFLLMSGFLAILLGTIFLRSLKKPEKKTEIVDDSNYEANYQQAVKEQEEYDEQIKQEKLKKFREQENNDMENDKKKRDFK